MPDLFFYRDPEEIEKEDRERFVIMFVNKVAEHISWDLRFSISLPLEPMCHSIPIVSLDLGTSIVLVSHQLWNSSNFTFDRRFK
jgi:hypothetical protein